MPLDPKPPSPDAQHLEELRLTPNEATWRLEIEKILDGVRDVIIEHRGDAGGYVDDLLGQAQDPAACRIAFQEALERQIEQWKPPRGIAGILELIRRFVPRSGFPRLVELFRSQKSFPGDPPSNEPEFLGRDLRLNALHALERYFPVAPLYSEDDSTSRTRSQSAFAAYIAILREHLQYPRYRPYSLRILERVLPNILDNVQDAEDIPSITFREAAAPQPVGKAIRGGLPEQTPEPDTRVRQEEVLEISEAKLYRAAFLEPWGGARALGSLYASFLTGGSSSEKEFRTLMKKHHAVVRYEKKGPVVAFADPSRADIKIRVSADLYHVYYPIYIQQTPRPVIFRGFARR